MTPQEIFDTVATHLFTQGRRSLRDGLCAYRGDNGLKCAVGILIPDEFYQPRMDAIDFLSAIGLVNRFPLPDWFRENKVLLTHLQSIHDVKSNWDTTSTMTNALKEIAKKYHLNPSILSTLSFSNR